MTWLQLPTVKRVSSRRDQGGAPRGGIGGSDTIGEVRERDNPTSLMESLYFLRGGKGGGWRLTGVGLGSGGWLGGPELCVEEPSMLSENQNKTVVSHLLVIDTVCVLILAGFMI